jgi:serine/threonine protein kinase
VNVIIVINYSQHANIVNFLDSFLQDQNNELWVAIEFMEGGALTDVIDNNPVIQEDQISTICFEVSSHCWGYAWFLLTLEIDLQRSGTSAQSKYYSP